MRSTIGAREEIFMQPRRRHARAARERGERGVLHASAPPTRCHARIALRLRRKGHKLVLDNKPSG